MWAIGELGIGHERLDYGHGFCATNTPEFLAKNPMGRVPVLEDDAVCIFESAAILRYLSAEYGEDAFWPSDPRRRATLDVCAEWGKSTFTEAVLDIFVYDVRMSPDTRDPDILHKAVAKLVPLATILDSQVTKGPWIGGSDFSFADVACGHILFRYFTLAWERPELPALAAYYERLKGRSAFRDHVMVSYEALRGSY